MPLAFDQGLVQLRQVREKRTALQAQLLSGRNQIAIARRELAAQHRTGNDVSSATTTLSSAQSAHRLVLDSIRLEEGKLRDTLADIAVDRDPADSYQQLDGSVPIALLPCRLETRFITSGETLELLIRIYPDQIHVDAHRPALTGVEFDLAKQYWRVQHTGDQSQIDAAWQRLCRELSAERTAWVVQQSKPLDPDAAVSELQFPDIIVREDGSDDAAKARLLPERWVAVGFQEDPGEAINFEPILDATGNSVLFRQWGEPIPDTLNVSVSFDDQADISEDESDLPIEDELRWMIDFTEAERVGMGIRVKDSDLPADQTLRNGVGFLVVLGVDWTQSPEQAAAGLGSLLQAHRYSDGCSFLPPGTVTNSTKTKRSALSSHPAASTLHEEPAHNNEQADQWHASARLTSALGLSDATLLEGVAHGRSTEKHTTSLLIDALWESTLGYYLDDMLDPVVDDHFIDQAREHAHRYLQPDGPLDALRVGKQPYGILPIIADAHFKPARQNDAEDVLHSLLTHLKWYWEESTSRVPQIVKSGNPDDDLLAVLQHNPVSIAKQFRRFVDSEAGANLEGHEAVSGTHHATMASLVLDPLAKLLGQPVRAVKLAEMFPLPTHQPLFAPWVQRSLTEDDSPLERNYLSLIVENMGKGSEGREALHEQSRSKVLLEAFIAYAALRELDRAASQTLDQHRLNTGLISQLPPKAILRTRSLLGSEANPPTDTQDQSSITTPEQLASLKITAITGDRDITLADFVSKQIATSGSTTTTPLRTLKRFRESVIALSSRPAKSLDYAFRSVCDAYSYRLDAWQSSLATRRLSTLRKEAPLGVHVGGFGWVHDLRPDTQPDSLGYVHTPSLDHAATAAILRSAHLSHRGAHRNRESVKEHSAQGAFAIDLQSSRVRVGLNLIEGVSSGQSLAALLGYRFERDLQNRAQAKQQPELVQYVFALRQQYPLNPARQESTEPVESIAARDVVDGVRLVEAWRSDPNSVRRDLKPRLNRKRFETIEASIRYIDDALDAVGDILVAEAAFQSVRGNHERSAAAQAALDRQSVPPSPQVVRTPRSGTRFQQRIMVTLQQTTRPPSWSEMAQDIRSATEPRLDAWLAGVIGDPSRVILAATVRDSAGTDASLTDTLHDFLRDEGLSALSLVLISMASDARAPSTLELLLMRRFAVRVQNPTDDTSLELDVDAPATAAPESIGFGALRTLLQLLHRSISDLRLADARDFLPADADLQDGIDTAELQTRLDALSAASTQVVQALEAAESNPTATTLNRALKRAFHLGAPDTIADVLTADDDALLVLSEQANAALRFLNDRLAKQTTLVQAFDATPAEDRAALHEHLLEQCHALLGSSFPMLPLFTVSNATELAASLNDRSSLLDTSADASGLLIDEFAPLTWMQQMAMVRPQVERISAVLSASEMLGVSSVPASWQVMQLPHVPGQRWAALASPETEINPELALLVIGDHNLNQPLAAFVVDGWSEIIPSNTETTGLTFHYDAPAARAPQSLLLAVPPETNMAHWSFDQVLAGVIQTYRQARQRGVGPRELSAVGASLLPALFVPDDRSRQFPGFDFGNLNDAIAEQSNDVIGKRFSNVTFD